MSFIDAKRVIERAMASGHIINVQIRGRGVHRGRPVLKRGYTAHFNREVDPDLPHISDIYFGDVEAIFHFQAHRQAVAA